MKHLYNISLALLMVLLLILFWYQPNIKTIAAGIAIFLFGMYFLKRGFNVFTGGLLENILKKGTNKLSKSIFLGAVTTAIMQSSALVSVILVSFVSANIISLLAGIGVIFGANIGATAGAWLVASFGLKVKISAYAMPMLVMGIILTFQKTKQLRALGYIIAGLGFLFLGIHFMREGFELFREHFDLSQYRMTGVSGLLIYVLIGIVITFVMQSSNAMIVLVITALSLQQISYENAVAIVIGANIGTTFTSIISSFSSNYRGRQLAFAHFIFNICTGIMAILAISYLTHFVKVVSDLLSIPADNHILRLAVFHSTFNILGVLLISPFIGKLVVGLNFIIKPKAKTLYEPAFLTKSSLDHPETLIRNLRYETIHLYMNISSLFVDSLHVHQSILTTKYLHKKEISKNLQLQDLNFSARYHKTIEPLIGVIIEFSGKGLGVISNKHQSQLFEIRLACVKLSESVMAIQSLQNHIASSFNSSNKSVINEYNKMRLLILSVLRALDRLKREEENQEESSALLRLEELKETIKKQREETNKRIDKLIRKNKINSVTATAILNDRSFARKTARRLLDAGVILFSPSDHDFEKVAKIVSLNDQSPI